jgi:hypothetical protein
MVPRAAPSASIDDILARAERLQNELQQSCSGRTTNHNADVNKPQASGQQVLQKPRSRLDQLLTAITSSSVFHGSPGKENLVLTADDDLSDDDAEDLILQQVLRSRPPPVAPSYATNTQYDHAGASSQLSQSSGAGTLRVSILDVLLRRALAGSSFLGMTATVRVSSSVQASAALAAAEASAPLAELLLPLTSAGPANSSSAVPSSIAMELWAAHKSTTSSKQTSTLLGIVHIPLSSSALPHTHQQAQQRLFTGSVNIMSISDAETLGTAVLDVMLTPGSISHTSHTALPGVLHGSSLPASQVQLAAPSARPGSSTAAQQQLRHTLQVSIYAAAPLPEGAAGSMSTRLPAARYLCYRFPGDHMLRDLLLH